MNAPPVTGTVPATLTPAIAATRRYGLVVVGAGPAGAALSLRLARQGHHVLLLDRDAMPRGKVCGCCLSPVALGELGALAPLQPSDGDGPPITGVMVALSSIALSAAGRSAKFAFPRGAVLSRERLDTALVRAAIEAGAEWLPHAAVANVGVSRDGVEVVVGVEGLIVTIRADACVLATGLVDRVRVHGMAVDTPDEAPIDPHSRCLIGLGCTLPAGGRALPPGELAMAVAPSGYCGMVRLEDGRIDVAAAIDRRAVRAAGGPADAVCQALAAAGDPDLLPVTIEAIRTTPFRATPPVTRAADPVSAGGRLLRVGDAAAYVEPFTGEGIGWALASARLLAEAHAANVPGDVEGVGRTYAGRHRRHFRSPIGRCRRVAALLRRPTLVSAAIASAAMMPWAAARLVPFLTGARVAGRGA